VAARPRGAGGPARGGAGGHRGAPAETPDAGPVPCPLLDPARGACLVYEARPIACRTYGYYTERDGGLHCSLVTRELEARGTADEVVWGHGEAISRALAEYGEALSLRDWMTEPLRGE